MRTFWKATLAALSFTAFVGVAGCASAQPYDDSGTDNGAAGAYGDYGYDQPPGGVPYDYDSGGYCDEWGCPDDYYDMPVYYGSVYYGGNWFNGPLYYRNWGGDRQYWVHGGWHNDGWQGQRPNWYRQGHYGPALGRSFTSSNRFRDGTAQRDRGGFNRGTDNRGDFNRPGSNRPDFNRNDNRGFNGRQDFNRNGGARSDGNASRPGNRSPQVQQNSGQRFANPSGQRQNVQRSTAPRGNGGGGGHGRGNRSR